MSNGGGSGGGRAQEPRSSDLWGRQLIFERRTFIFLEAENSPMETNSTVWICWCGSVCAFTRRSGVTHQECVCMWTRAGMCAWCVQSWQTPCSHEACGGVCGYCGLGVHAREAVCVHLCTPGCVCTLPTVLSKLGVPACVHSCGSLWGCTLQTKPGRAACVCPLARVTSASSPANPYVSVCTRTTFCFHTQLVLEAEGRLLVCKRAHCIHC